MKLLLHAFLPVFVTVTAAFSQTKTGDSASPFLVNIYYDRLGKALQNPLKTNPVGSRNNGNTFTALPSEAAVLVGLAVRKGDWFGVPIISSLQPIYETRKGRIRGSTIGKKTDKFPIVVEAKPGYVVTQLVVSAPQNHVHGIRLVFGRLDFFSQGVVAKDSYESELVGILARGKPERVGDASRPAIGLRGRADDWVAALGLLQAQ